MHDLVKGPPEEMPVITLHSTVRCTVALTEALHQAALFAALCHPLALAARFYPVGHRSVSLAHGVHLDPARAAARPWTLPAQPRAPGLCSRSRAPLDAARAAARPWEVYLNPKT